jgi:hypothetical protein
VAESLHFTHESFAESLLRLPRADEYEPLTEPMSRLAASLPRLLQALDEPRDGQSGPAPRTPAASRAGAATTPSSEAAAPARRSAPAASETAGAARARVREIVASAQSRLARALESLPCAEDYAPVARNLRALASVSPSLMAWLDEVPRLSTPLAEAVAGLREAAAELELAQDLLGAEDDPRPSRVKVVVRGAPA